MDGKRNSRRRLGFLVALGVLLAVAAWFLTAGYRLSEKQRSQPYGSFSIPDDKVGERISELSLAVLAGQVDVVEEFVAQGANVKLRTSHSRMTPLHFAALNGDIQNMRLLINAGADVGGLDAWKWTPLGWAIMNRHFLAMQLLLDHGAKVDVGDFEGCLLPLAGTIPENEVETIVDLLLSYGFDITQTDIWPTIVWHKPGLARKLFERGANPNQVIERNGNYSIAVNLFLDSPDLLALAIRFGADVSAAHTAQGQREGRFKEPCLRDKKPVSHAILLKNRVTFTTPVNEAALAGDATLTMRLIGEGGDVNAGDGLGNTPLMYAALSGNGMLVSALLRAGATVDLVDDKGMSALWYAGAMNDVGIMRQLLASGADVNRTDCREGTLLAALADAGCMPAVAFLAPLVRNVDEVAYNGRTPLYLAASRNRLDIAATLLDAGANVNWHDWCGIAPIHFALAHNSVTLAELFLHYNADISTLSFHAFAEVFRNANLKTMTFYFSRGGAVMADEYRADWFGGAFHSLIHCDPDVLDLAVKYGFNMSVSDNYGKTVLHYAVTSYPFFPRERFTHFLELGADANARDSDGRTPLHYAAGYNNTIAMALLLKHGADMNLVDNFGETPVFMAKRLRYTQAETWLRGNGAEFGYVSYYMSLLKARGLLW